MLVPSYKTTRHRISEANTFHFHFTQNTIYNHNDSAMGIMGTALAQWLWCCATNRKVACSIPDGVIGIFH